MDELELEVLEVQLEVHLGPDDVLEVQLGPDVQVGVQLDVHLGPHDVLEVHLGPDDVPGWLQSVLAISLQSSCSSPGACRERCCRRSRTQDQEPPLEDPPEVQCLGQNGMESNAKV